MLRESSEWREALVKNSHSIYRGVFRVLFPDEERHPAFNGDFYDLVDQAARGNLKLFTGTKCVF